MKSNRRRFLQGLTAIAVSRNLPKVNRYLPGESRSLVSLAIEHNGTIDASSGKLLLGIDSERGLIYSYHRVSPYVMATIPIGYHRWSRERYQVYEVKDHSELKAFFRFTSGPA